ncbi:hypothetical protein GW943_02845 [Candidatus Parcubacteria bacterium]|uniref:Uncharacterized protein n=1 Tax=Candidatus Kaiserbacteria bacterium CG10_big_fil_rev_8_21_14_0_10_47_16 TaxID=1974608 RepID=A0A2H0UDW0_9BACT|nr:hypothetical protein [Candidatus Parcubacteria bacterium]PIR84614.1 MAG: hypothetical protein COU16_03510 [Candidatus Kaiserbacteria bacterium CG10_big_fil_rev_8_21_14_0_10_47_16]
MKKTLIITIGVLILILVVGVWAYLFMFGTPKSTGEVFANFGLGNNDAVTTPTTTNDGTSLPISDSVFNNVIEARTFQQLTTKPVAGMTFVGSTTIRYMEQGTGYIFDIDTETGTERQVVGNTFTKVRSAVFSLDGTSVALTRDEGRASRITVGTIVEGEGRDTLRSVNLPLGSSEPHFSTTATSTFNYLYTTAAGGTGHAYNVLTGNDSVLFTIPFTSAHILWGTHTYVYTKPTAELAGYVYEIKNGSLGFVTNGGTGLMATAYAGGVITTLSNSPTMFSSVNPQSGGDSSTLPVSVIPEKCTFLDRIPNELVCAVPATLPDDATYPDDWYKGVISFADRFWLIDTANGSARLVADPTADAGRDVDVLKLEVNGEGTQFLFINKNDNTLWLLNLTDTSFVPEDTATTEN